VFVKMLQGRNRGEVIEMKYADAQMLLADGRAELAYPADAAAVAELASVETAKGDSDARKNPGKPAKQVSRQARRGH
jgi:hypothetical protein